MPPPTATAESGPETAAPSRPRRTRRTTLVAGLLGCAVLLVLVCLLSIAIGSKQIPLSTVIDALRHYNESNTDQVIVRSLRVPRTLIGLLVGAALGLSGALMQGVTRNPLADPGILGVNGGAALFVVGGIYWFGMTSLTSYVWLAFVGAAAASVAVYLLGSMGREGATPVKLALAGAALTAMLGSLTTALLIGDVDTFDQFRFWSVGSFAGRGPDIAKQVAPFILIGIVLALFCGRVLNALSLGDDVAKSLGQRVGLARAFVAVVVVLLAGAATAAAGPIGFVGLTIPHVARLVTGPDYRWILPYSALLAPILLLGSDVIGRVVALPGELQVGIVTAVLGAPFFIVLVRRRKLADL
ncbi:iron complex transport system permease protein [Kribbella aluminosa]|uniref:Iron complex transport system permease protein n=1 Tax=Kribbella aluminosa TaxID=416017 RepID=A0ABS4UP46_9ACTN|nr:iron chelate uptake ABC transporter family permease subunit [Kribbella aluminosa]MBP2353407.1 iron complex transport system permease protein [Kribbella aluminosa]